MWNPIALQQELVFSSHEVGGIGTAIAFRISFVAQTATDFVFDVRLFRPRPSSALTCKTWDHKGRIVEHMWSSRSPFRC